MEKKNMLLISVINISTLLVVAVGATFAYFSATITDNRTAGGGQAAVTATQTPGNLSVEQTTNGFASFNDADVYPGHKDLIQLKIKSAATNTTNTYFNIVYTGTNTFPANTIKFTLYESKTDLGSVPAGQAFICTKKSDEIAGSPGHYKLYEACTLNSQLTATTSKVLNTVNLPNQTSSTKTILNGTHPFMITGSATDDILYYYIVVEYVNLGSDQTAADKAKALSGKISVEIAPKDSSPITDADSNLSKKTA